MKARIDELRIEFERMSAIHTDYVRHSLLRTIEADPRDLYEEGPQRFDGQAVPASRDWRIAATSECRDSEAETYPIQVRPLRSRWKIKMKPRRRFAQSAGRFGSRHELSLEQLVHDSMQKPQPLQLAAETPGLPNPALQLKAERL